MQRSNVAVMMKIPVQSQRKYSSFLLKGKRTPHSRGNGMKRIMRSVLKASKYCVNEDSSIGDYLRYVCDYQS